MDDFTLARLTRMIESFKAQHGRDLAEGDLVTAGLDPKDVDDLVRKGVVDKYQVTAQGGRVENRFKLHRDWRSLNR